MEILVKAVDASNTDPTKDQGCYKRGDPVVVKPDGHVWGLEEGPPLFVVIRVPGVVLTPTQLAKLENRIALGGRRREYRLDLDAMDVSASYTLQTLAGFVINKTTQQRGL